MKAVIDYLLSNPEKAKQIAREANKLVLENCTWEKSAHKIVKIYKEILVL